MEKPIVDPAGKVCEFSAFGRDNIAGGNDVGIQAIGEFILTPQDNIEFSFFQVSYGVDTPIQDWVGDPFIVNSGLDPQGDLSFHIIIMESGFVF